MKNLSKQRRTFSRGSAEEGEIKRQGLEHEQDEQNRYGRAVGLERDVRPLLLA